MKSLLLFLALLLWGASVEARELFITTSDDVKLYVKVEGTGTPLLYLHGGPGSGSHWFDRLFGDFLEQHFTVVYLDQRGVGRSGSAENKDYSLERMLQDFEEVRQELGFDSWLTLGHSFGGILQMGYAEQFPQAIQGMIMLNGTLHLTGSACESWLPKAAEMLGEHYTCEGDTLPLPQRMNEFGGKLRSEELFWKMGSRDPNSFGLLDKLSSEVADFNYDYSSQALNIPDYWRNFKPLTADYDGPVLYYYGSNDFMVGPEHYKGIHFPNLLLWENKGGHVPFIEDKADLENAVLAYVGFFEGKG